MPTLCAILRSVLLLSLLTGGAAAALQRTDGPAAIANPAGALIAADGLDADPATNRHLVQMRFSVAFTAVGASANSGTFRARFALSDSSAVAQPLDDGVGGSTLVLVTAAQTVSLFDGQSQTLDFAVDAAPSGVLNLAKRHRAQVELQRFTSGVWQPVTAVQGPLTWLTEITNTTSPDDAYNVFARVEAAALAGSVIVRQPDGSGGFGVSATVRLLRHDDVTEPAPAELAAEVTTEFVLHDVTDAVDVPLAGEGVAETVSLPSFVEGSSGPEPAEAVLSLDRTLVPADWTQLNAAHLYEIRLRVSCTEADASTADVLPSPHVVASSRRLLALSGVIRFGGVNTGTFTEVTGDPRASFVDNFDGTWDGSVVFAPQTGSIGASSRRFGDGLTPLGVVLFANGDLACLSGTLAFSTAQSDLEVINGVRVVRGTVTLGNTGMIGDQFGVVFPTGFGFTQSATSRRLSGVYQWANLPLDDDLRPLGGGPLTIAAADFGLTELHAVQDGFPVRLLTSAIVWDMAAGTFTLDAAGAAVYVRAGEDALTPGDEPTSNDGPFRAVASHAGVVVGADSEGRASFSGTFGFGAGSFRSHHPFDARLAWVGGGSLVVSNGQIDVAQSSLSAPDVSEIPVERGCSKDGACAQTEQRVITFQADEPWTFTPDGGLAGRVTLATPEEVRWGKNGASTYAHRTAEFGSARFHMTGNRLPAAGVDGAVPAGQGAAVLHLTGFGAPDDATRTERPGVAPDATAREGRCDYAGLNFRIDELPAAERTATSRLAGGEVGPYPLHAAAKYYARWAGVSGRHQAAGTPPGQASSFSNVIMFGFVCHLDGLKLGYLDSDNVFSLTGGSIDVPLPSGFDQTFAELRFDCAGRPRDAALADDDVNALVHWGAEFVPLTFRFQPEISGGCPSTVDGVLVLGAAVNARSLTAQPLHAELGFTRQGLMTTKADGPRYAGTSSELTLPTQLKLKGGNGPDYTLTPHGKAYFSKAVPTSAPGEGWINVYGALDVPFFQDVKLQLHAENSASPTGAVHLMGGWPASDAAGNVHGWSEAGKTPFTDALFDAGQRGYPAGVSLADYRNPPAAQFRPRAEQDWLEVVKLGYALKWETAARRFTTLADEESDIVVIRVKHRLLSLTSSTAEITFGVQIDGFPALNVSKLLADEASAGLNGLFSRLTTAGLDAAGVNDAVRRFDSLLSAGVADLMDAPLDAALADPAFDFDPVAWAGNPALAADAYADCIADLALPQAPGVGQFTADLVARLGSVVAALDFLVAVVPAEAPQQNLAALVEAVLGNASDNGTLNGALQAVIGSLVAEASSAAQLEKSVPAFEELRASALRVRNRVAALRASLNDAANPLRREISRALTDDKPAYRARLQTELASALAPLGSTPALAQAALAERGAENVKRQLRDRVRRVLVTTGAGARIQAALKHHLAEPQQVFRSTLDSLFGEVNRCIRDASKSVLDEVQADALGLNSLNVGLGALSSTFKGFGIDGYAQINGDSLQRLRLDGKLSLKAADEMEFRGWLQIDALNATNPRSKCYCDNPASMTDGVEVTVGGEAPFSLFGGGDNSTKLRAQGQFAFGSCDGGAAGLMGVAGSFFLQGSVSVASIQIKELGLTFAFGRASNYFGARARANFKGYEFAGAFFAGSTCGIAPLLDVDPDIVDLLTSPSVGVIATPAQAETTVITGLYVYAEGWMPLNELIGIPDSCLFSLRAGAGAGPFAFVKDGSQLLLGSKQFFGITADVLCLAHAEASVKLLGSISIPLASVPADRGVRDNTTGLALRLLGIAAFAIEIGPCPFCIEFSKDVKFHAQLGGNNTSFGFGH